MESTDFAPIPILKFRIVASPSAHKPVKTRENNLQEIDRANGMWQEVKNPNSNQFTINSITLVVGA